MDRLVAQAIGWYGKLPARGDFVGRGLPRDWLRTWDDWLQRGLAGAALHWGEGFHERLLAMPAWHFVVLAQQPDDPSWCAAVVASADRVGRPYPLVLAQAYDAAVLDGVALAQVQALGRCLVRWLNGARGVFSPNEFERYAARWAATPWDCVQPAAVQAGDDVASLRRRWPAAASFWWRADAELHAPLAAPWPPADELMLALLNERA